MAANILKFWLNEQKNLWKKKEKCKVYSNFSLLKTGVKKYQPNLSKDFIKILFYKDFWIKSDQ